MIPAVLVFGEDDPAPEGRAEILDRLTSEAREALAALAGEPDPIGALACNDALLQALDLLDRERRGTVRKLATDLGLDGDQVADLVLDVYGDRLDGDSPARDRGGR